MTLFLLESYFDFYYAMEIKEKFSNISRKICEGCNVNSLSQNGHTCIDLSIRERLELYFEDIVRAVDEQELLLKWDNSVQHLRDTIEYHMYKLNLFCRDWREADMKTASWKCKMIRMTLQLIQLETRF